MKLIFDNEDFEAPMLEKLAEACNKPDEKYQFTSIQEEAEFQF